MGTVQTNCCKPLLLNTLNGESSLAAKQLLSAGGELWSEHVGSEL